MFSSCKADKIQNSELEQNKNFVFSNEILFEYDENSELTINSFDGINEAVDLNTKYPIIAVRQNKEECYTVYSLKDRKLAYVIFLYNPYTGRYTFFVKDVIEYPYSSLEQEQLLSFLLPQDLPEEILK